jgi:glycosyltransferase involved in cell wall biosynthesis
MIPRVSAVMPTRDRRGLLARALASIEAQRFRDFEVVVVDDGSVDGTASWLRARQPPVSLVEIRRPGGAAAARNRGVESARGEIVAFLDDDDVWHPDYLGVQVAQIDAHPEADLCTTGHIEIDPAGRVARPDLRPLQHYPEPLVHFLAECPIHTLSVVACRRAVFQRIGPFDENLSIVHDLDWYLRLVAAGGRMVHCPAALVERAVPGGLVTQHRHWFVEERAVHQRFFAKNQSTRPLERRVRVLRALFFARVGLTKGDLDFGLARLADAFFISPPDALSIAGLRLLRRCRRGASEAWDATAGEAR